MYTKKCRFLVGGAYTIRPMTDVVVKNSFYVRLTDTIPPQGGI